MLYPLKTVIIPVINLGWAYCRKCYILLSFIALAFHNGLEDCNADEGVNSSDDPATSDI